MDLADALDAGQQSGQSNNPTWPGQPQNPSWPGQPFAPMWPGQQPAQQPGPGMPVWPGQPNQPTMPGWPGPAPPTAPQNVPLTVPYEQLLPSGVYDRMLITIQGEVKKNAKGFIVNLSKNKDIAFHFNPRFNEDGKQVIVRNTFINNIWGREEREAPSFPFALGKPFEMKILATLTEFKVAVNKSHLLEYKHRFPDLSQINRLNVFHDVTLTSVLVETLK